MPKTINSLLEDEIGHLTVADQQQLIDAGLFRELISTLNESNESFLENPPVNRDLSALDYNRQVAESRILSLRVEIQRIIGRLKRWSGLKEVA
jgi:hypothetical protein